MSLRLLRPNTLITAVSAALLLITVVGDLQAAPRLSRSDFYRYRSWVRVHDTVADGTGAEAPFPGLTGIASDDVQVVDQQLLMTAAHSLLVLEDFLVREWKRTESFTADQNLSTARSYRDVGEYDKALRWYRSAQLAPRSADVDVGALRHEIFAVAVMTSDSLQVTRELLNLVGMPDLTRDQDTVELALRWLVTVGDTQNLDHLMHKVEGQMAGLGPRLWFWYAYVQIVQDDREGCARTLAKLLARFDATETLSRQQRGWILRTYADLHYLSGRLDDALRLYNLLAELDGSDGGWGRYQLANHHLLAGEYAEAEAIYGGFCANQAHSTWEARACEMAALVAQLDEIRKEGEPYGTDVIHGR